MLSFGPYTVDLTGGVLSEDGRDVPLPPKAMGVLLCLLKKPGAVVTKEEIFESVWSGTSVTDGSLTEAVRTLRGALGDDPQDPRYVQTVHRRGYRFIADVRLKAGKQLPQEDVPNNGGNTVAGGLNTIVGTADAHAEQPATIGSRSERPRLVRLIGVFALGAAASAIGFAMLADPGSSVPAAIFEFGPPPDTLFFPQSHAVSVAPDGSAVVVGVTSGSDAHRLSERRIDSLELRPLLGSVDRWATYPSYAPDGTSVVYVAAASNGIERVGRDGDERQVLCEDCVFPRGRFAGLDVGPAGGVVFAHGPSLDDDAGSDHTALWRLPAGGGTPELLLPAGTEEAGVDYLWPRFLPSSPWMLVTLRRGHDVQGARIVALDIGTGEHRTLIEDGFNARYVDTDGGTGHLLFGRDGNLWAVAFDPSQLRPMGEAVPIPLEKPVAMTAANGSAGFDVSDNGTLAYHPGVFERYDYTVVAAANDGEVTPLIDDRGEFLSARLSPDGTRLATCMRNSRDEIRVHDLVDSANSFDIAHATADLCNPVWNPQGTRLAFSADGKDLYTVAAVENAETRLLVRTEGTLEPVDWSPGGLIVFNLTLADGTSDIWTIDADCEQVGGIVPCDPEDRRPFLATESDEVASRLSPDGRWLAARLGTPWTVFAVPFPDGGEAVHIGRGTRAQWAVDGDTLHLRAMPRGWLRFPWNDDGPGAGAPRQPSVPRGLTPVDILRDGTGFIAIDKSARRVPTTTVVVITNWFDDLRRLAPRTR